MERIVVGVSNVDMLQGAAKFSSYADQMYRLAAEASRSVLNLSVGENNQYRLLPRGEGLVVIEKEFLGKKLAERIAAPLAAGNSCFVSVTGSPENEKKVQIMRDLLRSAGIGEERVRWQLLRSGETGTDVRAK